MSEILTSSPPRVIPVTYEIKRRFYCKRCIDSCPRGMDIDDLIDISVGQTSYGWQVWCRKHGVNVIHIDFCGQTLPANIATRVG